MQTLLIPALTFSFAVAWAVAEEPRKTAPAGAESAALTQKTCPVSGKPVSRNVFTEYKKLKIYFCSEDCIEKFKDEPGRYLPAVYRQIYPQTVQVTCPVTGAPVDGKTFAEYKGTKVGLCSPTCADKFKTEPAKYIARLKDCSTNQVHCPVHGKPISPAVSKEYEGRKVYFCEKGCLAKFETDTARYADRLRPEAGVLARGPTAADDLVLCPTCAVGGGGHHTRKQSTTLVHDGKTYFFCCEHCVARFKTDPGRFIKAVEAEMKNLAPEADERAAGDRKP